MLGPLIRQRLSAAEAEIQRRQRVPEIAGPPPPLPGPRTGPVSGGWPVAPPPLASSSFRLNRLIHYRAGVPPPNRCTPMVDPLTRRLVLASAEQELWVHPDTLCAYYVQAWSNAPSEEAWDAPDPTIVVVTNARATMLCYRFIGAQAGRDYYHGGVLGGTWTGLAASMASRRMRNGQAAREE